MTIQKNKPSSKSEAPLHDFVNEKQEASLFLLFKEKLEKAGAVVSIVEEAAVDDLLKNITLQQNVLVNVPGHGYSNPDIFPETSKEKLNLLDFAVLEARLGVAENGAIWIEESMLAHRAVPFITQDLMVVIHISNLVGNLHQAYKNIELSKIGYGIFIAGPSKTADIEQSLVIGAHGAKSLQVVVVQPASRKIG